MVDYLIALDQSLFLLLHKLGHPYLNDFMWWMSHRFIWAPLYIVLLLLLYRQYRLSAYIYLIVLILVVIFTDQFTSSFMKPFFGRLRPCHDPDISLLIDLIGHCGGKFGFASGHAANTFGLASFFFFLKPLRKVGVGLLIWASIVSYSRIYLGVHYPLDIVVGIFIGISSGFLATTVLKKLTGRNALPLYK